MTSIPWQAFGSFGLACAALGFLTGLFTLAAINSHREKRQFDAEIEAHEQQIERNRAPRHAKSQPRASEQPPTPAAVPEQPRTSLVSPRSGYRDSWRFPVGDGPQRRASASDLAPVYLADGELATVAVSPYLAPLKRDADDSGLMPRVKLTDTNTGGMTKLTDEWIAAHCPDVVTP